MSMPAAAAAAAAASGSGGGALTDLQRSELHEAVSVYLRDRGFHDTCAAFEREAGVVPKATAAAGTLERKWALVVRLQRKCMELEQKIKQLEEDMHGQTAGVFKPTAAGQDYLPSAPALHTLTGHRSPVTCIRFHPTFALVATGSEDATIKTWDSDSGELEATLKGHTNCVNHISFDSSGRFLASAAADMTVRLWEIEKRICVRTFRGHEHTVSCVEFHPDPNQPFLASCSRDMSIRIWDTASGHCVRSLQGHSDWVRKLAFSPEGSLLASCAAERTVRLWNFATGECTAVLADGGHDHLIESICFIPASDAMKKTYPHRESSSLFLASCGRDKKIVVWDLTMKDALFVLTGHENWVRAVVSHPLHPGKFIISCSDDKSIRVWDLTTQRCVKKISPAHDHFVSDIALCARGKHLLLGSCGVDLLAKIWPCVPK